MTITIAIADPNKEYLTRLSRGLKKYECFSVSVFTDAEQLIESMKSEEFDILLFNPDISKERLQFPTAKLCVCLSSDETENRMFYPDYKSVIKYQRISNICKEILKLYIDKAISAVW